MSHIAAKSAYKSLEERINRFPHGAPPSETLYKILSLLFTEKEAQLVAQLPIKPFNLKTAARIWKIDETSTRKILEALASKALILDSEHNGEHQYVIPPPMAGFFEFSLMRVRQDIDQKLLSELFHQYINVEEDFIKGLFLTAETRFGRVLVQEEVLSNDNEVEILDFERATHVVKNASFISVSTCYCRHKAYHLGTVCDAPMEVCMTFNNTAQSLINNGYGRSIDASEAIEILDLSKEHNLVQCGENVRKDLTFLCNCCGCCCDGMATAKKFGSLHPIQTTAYIPKVKDSCIGCGKCAKVCPIEAIEINTLNDDKGIIKKKAIINEDICLGCGVCARNCVNKSIFLERRKEKIITPVTTTHRVVVNAIETGKLADLIFDNKAFASHRAMAAILSVILKLPPIKRAMASKQMKSVYLDNLIDKMNI